MPAPGVAVCAVATVGDGHVAADGNRSRRGRPATARPLGHWPSFAIHGHATDAHRGHGHRPTVVATGRPTTHATATVAAWPRPPAAMATSSSSALITQKPRERPRSRPGRRHARRLPEQRCTPPDSTTYGHARVLKPPSACSPGPPQQLPVDPVTPLGTHPPAQVMILQSGVCFAVPNGARPRRNRRGVCAQLGPRTPGQLPDQHVWKLTFRETSICAGQAGGGSTPPRTHALAVRVTSRASAVGAGRVLHADIA